MNCRQKKISRARILNAVNVAARSTHHVYTPYIKTTPQITFVLGFGPY